nr:class I SAM-dependent methyltransferase [Variovorax boronicumulans]
MQTDFDFSLVPTSAELLRSAAGATVVDCGCHGWRLAQECERGGHLLIGIDQVEPSHRPLAARYAGITNGVFDVADDTADFTIASHVLEHVGEPVPFFRELCRVTKPGGTLLIEAPSELSALASASNDPTDHKFLSFWDDPTHVRPWTPAALYRLALSCRCVPLAVVRSMTDGIPTVRMLARKPDDIEGEPPVRYVTLRDVEPSLAAAWAQTWGAST